MFADYEGEQLLNNVQPWFCKCVCNFVTWQHWRVCMKLSPVLCTQRRLSQSWIKLLNYPWKVDNEKYVSCLAFFFSFFFLFFFFYVVHTDWQRKLCYRVRLNYWIVLEKWVMKNMSAAPPWIFFLFFSFFFYNSATSVNAFRLTLKMNLL